MDKNRKASRFSVLICNVCGKKVTKEHGIYKEDMVEVNKEWGYFSKYDLEVHNFNICESCYDEFIAKLTIPMDVKRKKEIL